MVDLIIGDVDDDVVARVQSLAALHGRSFDDEVMAIIVAAMDAGPMEGPS